MKERITVRFDHETKQRLAELTTALNTSYSLLIRSLVSNALTVNQIHFDEMIDENNKYKIN